MVTKKTIAEIRRSFAQFFADADNNVPRSRYVWIHPNSDLDNDATLRNNTSTVINPLNELKCVDCFQTKVSHKPKEEKLHLPVDRQKENEKSLNVYGIKRPAAVQESVVSTAKRRKLSRRADNEADATIGNLNRDFESSEKCADINEGQPFNSARKSVVINETTGNCSDNSKVIDDNDNESTVSDQLNAYIKIYEQKEPTLATIKEMEWIIGKPAAQPIIESAEEVALEPSITVSSVDVVVSLPDRQQLSESQHCIPKRHKIKPSHNLKGVVDWQPLLKLRKLRKNPKSQKPLSTSKTKKSTPKSKRDCNEKKNSKNVIEPFAPSNAIQSTLTGDRKLIESATPMRLIKQKTLSVSEWIRESSQVQPDNNADDMNMNEFLQDVDLPILSDIEDDAFQLARYIEQSLNESRYTSSVNTTATQLPEQPSNDNGASKPLDQWNDCSQPLDLSVKQTPMSTDTGFCNDSFLLDATPPYRCCGTDGAEPVYANHIANNWNVDTNAWMNGSRKYAEMENTSRLHGNVNILSPAPSMSSVIIPSTLQNNEIELSTPVDLSQRSTQRHIADPIMEVTAEIDRPIMEERIQQSRPQPTDWTMDNYSTDLDYEPSEDEDNRPLDITFLNQRQQTSNHQPPKTRNSFTIRIPNNSSTSRVVFETSSMRSQPFKSACVNIVEPLAHQNLPFHSLRPDPETTNPLIKQQMVYLFKGTCFNYLKGKKCTAANCKFDHKLPTSHEILKKLHLFSNDTIWGVYTKWIVQYQNTFESYFPTICDVLRSRNMKTELLAAVEHCERRNKMSYYLHIYSSLIMMNVSKLDALTKIGESCCKTKMACTVLLNVMAKDPIYFIELLKKYYQHAHIRTHHMLSMLRKIIKNPTPSVLALFVDIFEKYSMSDVCDIGEYRAIFSETKRLVVDDIDLHQKLYQIALRDKRIDF